MTDSHNDIIPNAIRNGKTVVTNFTKCVPIIVAFWRHNVWPFRGIRLESLNSCTRARFCCRVEVGSPISAFRFPLCVSIVNLKNTMPSNIPREHYRQHCQYRLRGLRYIARGLASSIIKGQRTTPSGDIPREHYRQHCQYRVRGLRYIARGLASSIIKRNMHISNRWRHILNASTARNYRKKYI